MLMRVCHSSLLALLIFLAACAPKPLTTEILSGGVRFFLQAPRATGVAIAGSFNHWDTDRDRLTGPDKKGVWTILLQLPPGRYEYRFVIDGRDWVPDPSAPSVDDGLGGKNSVITVPTQ